MTLAERFWAHVAKSDGCWVWTGYDNGHGYGVLKMGGQTHAAHRLSWELHFGPVTDGLWVLHKCDNPPCVRPDHLFLGPPKLNIADMIAKRRGNPITASGEANCKAKLTDDQVRELRLRYAAGGITMQELGESYGVGKLTVFNIIHRKSWTHVD